LRFGVAIRGDLLICLAIKLFLLSALPAGTIIMPLRGSVDPAAFV
jgi:hypothetical protein